MEKWSVTKTDMSSADILQALQEIKPNQMIPLRAIKYTPKMKYKPKEESKLQEKVTVKLKSKCANENLFCTSIT